MAQAQPWQLCWLCGMDNSVPGALQGQLQTVLLLEMAAERDGVFVFPACSSQGTSSAMNLTTVDLIVYSSNTRPIYKSFHPISFYLIWMFRCQSK